MPIWEQWKTNHVGLTAWVETTARRYSGPEGVPAAERVGLPHDVLMTTTLRGRDLPSSWIQAIRLGDLNYGAYSEVALDTGRHPCLLTFSQVYPAYYIQPEWPDQTMPREIRAWLTALGRAIGRPLEYLSLADRLIVVPDMHNEMDFGDSPSGGIVLRQVLFCEHGGEAAVPPPQNDG